MCGLIIRCNDVVNINANVVMSTGKAFNSSVSITGNEIVTGNITCGKYLSANAFVEPIVSVASSANITLNAQLGSLFYVSGNLSANCIYNWINLPSTSDVNNLYHATVIYQANAYACGNIVQVSSTSSAGTAYVPKFSGGQGNLVVSSYGNLTVQRLTLQNAIASNKIMSSVIPYY